MAITGGKMIVKIKIDDSENLTKLGLSNQTKTLVGSSGMTASEMVQALHKAIFRGLGASQKESLQVELEESFQLANNEDGKITMYAAEDKPLEGLETAPTTLVYLNKDKKAEERKKSDPPPTASPSSLKHNNSFSLGDFTASTADKMKFEKHKGETAMEFANRRVLLGWANHRLSLSDKEAIVDIVSDFSNGIALCHLLEALTDSTLKGIDPDPKENKIKCLENIRICLKHLKSFCPSFPAISPNDVYDQIYATVMLFMWKLALAFHIEDPVRLYCQIPEEEQIPNKDIMADYINYANRRVKLIPQRCRPQPVFNLSSSFQDGSAILAITASYDPTFLAVMENVDISIDKRLMRAFGRLQTLYEIPPILAIEDILEIPNPKGIMAYLAYIRSLVEEDECESGPIGGAQKRMLHVAISKEKEFETEGGFVVGEEKEVFLTVYEKEEDKNATEVESELAYYTIFRNVKIGQPGDAFLTFDCVDAGCIGRKRQMKIKFAPLSKGDHIFSIFDEVEGSVTPYSFTVITQKNAEELKQKKITEEEERRKVYRELEEKRERKEKEAREKRKEEEEKRRGEREEGKAKRRAVGARVKASEEVGVGERALEGLVAKINQRKQNLTKGPKLVENLHLVLQILSNFLETLSTFTNAVGEGWEEGAEDMVEEKVGAWLSGACGGWRGGCCGVEGVWEEVDGVLINDGMIDEEMHLDTCDKFLEIVDLFRQILKLLVDGDFEEVKGEIYKIYKIAVFFETDVTYGDGLRTMLQIVADDSAPIPKPPRMTPPASSLPPPPLAALPPPLSPSSVRNTPFSTSSLPPPIASSSPAALPPPPSMGGMVGPGKEAEPEEKNEVLLLKYLNGLSILSLEASRDDKITLSRCAELSPIIQNVTNCCRLLSAELPNHSPLFLSLPSTLSPAVMGVVRGRGKEGGGGKRVEKFLEVRKVANGVRKRVVGIFKRFRELYEFVGEVCQLGNMIDLFESTFVLLHESNVFTMKDFKTFLSTQDWNAFLLPVKLKRIMAFCFEAKIQKEGGIPLIPLNEVNYLPSNITILKMLTSLEQLDTALCNATPPPPPPPFPPVPSTPPPSCFPSLGSSPLPLSFAEWPLTEDLSSLTHERLLSVDITVKNAIQTFSEIFSDFSDSLNRGVVGGEEDAEKKKERREERDKAREWVEGWLVGGVSKAVWLAVVGEMGMGEGLFVSENERERGRKRCAASGFAMVAPSFLFEKEKDTEGDKREGSEKKGEVVIGWGMKKEYLEGVYGLVVRWGLLDNYLKGVNEEEEEEEEEGKRGGRGGKDGERKRKRKREEEKAKRILDVWSGVSGVEGVVERVPKEGEKVREVGRKVKEKEEEMMERLKKGEGEGGAGEEIVLSQAVCMEKVDQIDSAIVSVAKILKNDADSPQLIEEIDKLFDSYVSFCDSIWKVFQGMSSAKKRQRLRDRFQIFSDHLILIISAITNARYHLTKYVNDLQDQYFPIQVALGVTELRAGEYVLIQHSISKRFLGSSSGQFADVSPVVLTYDIFSHSSGGEDLEVKSEWKFDFLPHLPLAPETYKCLIKNATTEEFFGPDPYFFESNLDDVELCSSLEQKFSSEWNIELWEGDEDQKKGEKKRKGEEEEEIQRKGALRFVLRNSMTLNYLCVVDKEITWVSAPSAGCVFCVVGPGAERISKRLKMHERSEEENLGEGGEKTREFIVEWDFEVENKGEIAVEAGEIVYLEKDKHPDWIKIRRKDQKVGYIPRAYAKPFVGRTQGKSISLIVELARDPQNIKELIVDSKISFDGLKESIGHSFGALVSDLASVAGSSITSVSQLRPYDRVVVKLGSDQRKGGGDEAWQSQSDKKVLADDIIASALLDQRAPSRNWYRNKQRAANTDEVKGMLRVFLPDDPALDKFGLRCSVFTIKYFGITMRAAHLKAAVKEQMCSKSRIKDELLEYTKRFVIVEVKPDSHRVVSRREPLGKWEKDNCPANTRLMYVPILSHFNFKVNYHASQVKVNTWFHVRLHVTDPIHLDRSVDQMEADLAVWVRNSLGTESEYEMVQDHEKRGCFIAKLRFATAGRYRACIKFDGFSIQSKNTTIHVHTSGFGNKIRRVMRNVPHISTGSEKAAKEGTPELSAHSFFDSPKPEPKEKQKKKTEKKNRKLFG